MDSFLPLQSVNPAAATEADAPARLTPEAADWYVLQVGSGAEAAVAREAGGPGRLVWYPVETRTVRHARTRTTVRRPLFPGYVFVGVQPGANPGRAAGVKGVQRLLGSGTRPIAPGPVLALMNAETRGAFDRSRPKTIRFVPGQPVRIIAGPFTGFVAEVLSANGEARRIRILMKLLGGGPMEIDADKVAPAEGSDPR